MAIENVFVAKIFVICIIHVLHEMNPLDGESDFSIFALLSEKEINCGTRIN